MKNLLVIFGGRSSEYEVSLRSAAFVLRSVPRDQYNILKLGITSDGCWLLFDGEIDDIENDRWNRPGCVRPAILSPDFGDGALLVLEGDTVQKIKLDVIFPVLHGKNGEDGTIQGLFEMSGIPYVGCSPLSSAMCMDKAVTNAICDVYGIRQAKWVAFSKYDYENGKADLEAAAEKLGFPIFVKPANAGSSVGISKAHDFAELKSALVLAFKNDSKAVLEETVIGREVECAVMGNDEPVASCVGEIVPCNDFYDYDAKYLDAGTKLMIPAKFPDGVGERIRTEAVRVFRALGCSGLSRVDFFYGKNDEIYMNEVNTIPGFTSISMFPMLFREVGVSSEKLISRLLDLAIEKHHEA